MQIEVYFSGGVPAPGEVSGRVVLVIDVLRASTTIAVALDHGARAVIPFESTDEVVTRSKGFERRDVLLAGERRMRTIPGFDLGNSPREFTREVVEGKTILFSTSNGTHVLSGVQGARDVLVGAFVNFSAVVAMLRAAARSGTDISIVCAGSERQFALEDAVCAGRFVRAISQRGIEANLNDSAQAAVLLDRYYGRDLPALFEAAAHGRALREAGFGEDLAVCASVDAHPSVPVLLDRQVVRLGTSRER